MTYIEFPKGARFIGQSYWAAIGYGFAAGLGACFGAGDNARVVCVEGDGSFQMTAQEISTMVRYDKRAIIIMLNNRGYTAERLIHEGDYNDIQNWEYHRVAEVFGGSPGWRYEPKANWKPRCKWPTSGISPAHSLSTSTWIPWTPPKRSN